MKSYDLAVACARTAVRITPDQKTAVLSNWHTVLNWLTHDPAEVSRSAEVTVERYPYFELEELIQAGAGIRKAGHSPWCAVVEPGSWCIVTSTHLNVVAQ